MKTLITLRSLGLSFDENQANEEGWLTISAPHRGDKNPSFAVNIKHGGWKDNATGESGNIYDLVRILNPTMSWPEIQKFVDGYYTTTSAPKKYHIDLNSEFWTSTMLDRLQRAQDELEHSNSSLLATIKEYDLLSRATLKNFGCGLIEYDFGNGNTDALLIPYPTGAQVYARNESGKQIRMLKGSEPRKSFFGSNMLQRNRKLIITKSPREAMLAHQQLGDEFDVLGISSGETNKISTEQAELLEDKKFYWGRVFISFDRDTLPAEETAFGFARAVCDTIGDYKREIRLLNIPKVSNHECKDLTDLYKSRYLQSIDQLFEENDFEFSEYVWNTYTDKYRFWSISDKGKLEINEVKFANVLGKFGYKKSYFGEADVPTLVQDECNILHEVSTHQLSDFVLDKILEKFSKYVDIAQLDAGMKMIPLSDLQKMFFRYRDKVLSTQIKAIFRQKDIKLLTDGSNNACLFYKNGTVVVKKDSYKLINHSEMDGKIWKSQIMEREFDDVEPGGKGDIERFIENVSDKDPMKKRCFMATLGYLLHTYKNRAGSPAVILIDEKSSPMLAEGGTGKGLFAQSIKHMRKQRYIAGKNVDPSSRFFFMDVQLGDQSLFFDDVRPDFDFEALFNIITDDMQVEAKYKNRITIRFENSPKIILSTNYVVQGLGNSFARRQHILPFSDHYLKNPTPEVEFGHKLFDDWDKEEWKRYDHFMIRCLQLYLKEGLIKFPTDAYRIRELRGLTSNDFYEWAEPNLEIEREYPLNVLYEGLDRASNSTIPPNVMPVKSNGLKFACFLNVSNDLAEGQMRKFREWIDYFANYKGWKVQTKMRNGYSVIRFTEGK